MASADSIPDAPPPQYKGIAKYLVQAKKLDKMEPQIAYYCTFSDRFAAI